MADLIKIAVDAMEEIILQKKLLMALSTITKIIKEIFSKFLVIKIRLFHYLKMKLKANIMR